MWMLGIIVIGRAGNAHGRLESTAGDTWIVISARGEWSVGNVEIGGLLRV